MGQSWRSFKLETPEGKNFSAIITGCAASVAHMLTVGSDHPPIVKFQGLWDTGASNTVISQNVVDVLDLKPAGSQIISR